jgi:hypothetical protein
MEIEGEVSDGEIQRCKKRCQEEALEIHPGKKKSQTSEKVEIAAKVFSRFIAVNSSTHGSGFENG